MKDRVLVVDDEKNMLQTIEIILSDEGFEIETSSSVSAALKKVKKHKYRCVISDIKMPDIDGIEFVKQLKEYDNEVPVVLMTAYATVETAIQAVRLGVYDYLMKPFEHEHLVRIINKAVEYSLLRDENQVLKQQLAEKYEQNMVIGTSAESQAVAQLIEKVADSDSTVLITGRSGTGKEVAAYRIHAQSPRAAGPFVTLNCTAIADTLIESEFFGVEKGAYTGAVSGRKGKFETAHGGTIFLDEIGDMKIEMQAKLLRVLEQKTIERVGGTQKIDVDVRIIAATNKDLKTAVKNGSFRDDLFFRLNVFPIRLPDLKNNREDIQLLTEHFVKKYSIQNNKIVQNVSDEVMQELFQYHWPGNIRELSNVIERAVIVCSTDTLRKKDLMLTFSETENEAVLTSLENVEKMHIRKVLKAVGNKKTEAASILEIDRTTLYRLCKKYNIE